MLSSIGDTCRETACTFDAYNAEARALTTVQGHSGVRTEVSKTVFPFLQISRIAVLDRSTSVSQIFGTVSLQNSLVQLSMDHENSLQLRATHLNRNILAKLHTIVSSRKDVFSQVELEMRNKINSFGLKLIAPAVKGANMIYVANVLQQFGSLGFGAEVIAADSSLGVSLCGRHEHRRGVFSIGLQQFTALHISYYHRLNSLFDFGTEIRVSQSHPSSAAVGCRLATPTTELKATINSDMSLGFSLDERLTEGLSLNINTEITGTGCFYGFGFSLEF